jgi:hypothetical protein
MPQSVWSIGKSAVAGALFVAVIGVIIEAILGVRFPLSLLPLVMAMGATIAGYYVSKKPRPRRTVPTPDLGSARFQATAVLPFAKANARRPFFHRKALRGEAAICQVSPSKPPLGGLRGLYGGE